MISECDRSCYECVDWMHNIMYACDPILILWMICVLNIKSPYEIMTSECDQNFYEYVTWAHNIIYVYLLILFSRMICVINIKSSLDHDSQMWSRFYEYVASVDWRISKDDMGSNNICPYLSFCLPSCPLLPYFLNNGTTLIKLSFSWVSVKLVGIAFDMANTLE